LHPCRENFPPLAQVADVSSVTLQPSVSCASSVVLMAQPALPAKSPGLMEILASREHNFVGAAYAFSAGIAVERRRNHPAAFDAQAGELLNDRVVSWRAGR